MSVEMLRRPGIVQCYPASAGNGAEFGGVGAPACSDRVPAARGGAERGDADAAGCRGGSERLQ